MRISEDGTNNARMGKAIRDIKPEVKLYAILLGDSSVGVDIEEEIEQLGI